MEASSVNEEKSVGVESVDRKTEQGQQAAGLKRLIQRFENAVFHEAEAEYRALSDRTLERRSNAVSEARKELTDAYVSADFSKLLVKKILEHAESYEWELKGLGMMRTYLSEDSKIHVWDSRYKIPNVSLTHEHPWTFESTIIAGRLRNVRLLAIPLMQSAVDDVDVNPFMRSVVQCGPGGCLLEDPTLVHLNAGSTEVYNEGESYQQRFDEIHQSYPEDGTVTIVRRVDYKEPRAAAVYWPHGQEWVSSEPVMATPSKIRDIASNALQRWF